LSLFLNRENDFVHSLYANWRPLCSQCSGASFVQMEAKRWRVKDKIAHDKLLRRTSLDVQIE
jgi:hypothetical protein